MSKIIIYKYLAYYVLFNRNYIQSFEVITPESDHATREEILQLCPGIVGLLWSSHQKLDAEVLDVIGPQLKSISTASAGLDKVDVVEIKRRKIPLGHTPIVLNDAVADMTMGLMIAAARRYHEADLKIRNGEWLDNPQWMLGKDIRGSQVGIFGFGNIGQTIAKRLSGFDVGRIVYSGRNRKQEDVERKFNAKYVSFSELIKTSDYVIIAAPLTNETRNMFNGTVFEQMKSTAVLVNVARGAIVNTEDLYEALKERKIFSAGLDVVYPEPLPTDHPLLSLDNIGEYNWKGWWS